MKEAFWTNEMLVEKKKHVHSPTGMLLISWQALWWWMDPKGWEGPGVCYSRDSRVVMDYRSSPIAGTTLPLCRHMARHGVASPMSGLHMSEASVSPRRSGCKLHDYCLDFCGTQQSQFIYMDLIRRNYCSKYDQFCGLLWSPKSTIFVNLYTVFADYDHPSKTYDSNGMTDDIQPCGKIWPIKCKINQHERGVFSCFAS